MIAHLYATEGVAGFRAHARDVRGRDLGRARGSGWCWRATGSARSRSTTSSSDGELLFGSESQGDPRGSRRACRRSIAAALLSFLTSATSPATDAIFHGMRRLEPGTRIGSSTHGRGASTSSGSGAGPTAARPTTAPEGEVIERAARGADRSGADPAAIRCAARRVSQRRHGLGRGARADGAGTRRGRCRPSRSASATPTTTSCADARSTAAHFGADHHEQIVTPDCVRVRRGAGAALRRAVRRCVGDSDLLRRRARAPAVTVCLTGDGGDELFAGYTPYARRARAASACPAPVAALRRSVARRAAGAGACARQGPADTMALGPEAWFVWRRTVFPDYLLEAVVEPDVIAARRRLPERRSRGRFRAAAVRCCRVCSAGISATICPTTSSSRSIARRWRIRSRRDARCSTITSSSSRRAQPSAAPRRRRTRPSGCSRK